MLFARKVVGYEWGEIAFLALFFCFVWLGVVFAKLNLIFKEWKCRKIKIQTHNLISIILYNSIHNQAHNQARRKI